MKSAFIIFITVLLFGCGPGAESLDKLVLELPKGMEDSSASPLKKTYFRYDPDKWVGMMSEEASRHGPNFLVQSNDGKVVVSLSEQTGNDGFAVNSVVLKKIEDGLKSVVSQR